MNDCAASIDLLLEALFLLATAAFLFFLVQNVLRNSFFLAGEKPKHWVTVGLVSATICAFAIYFASFYAAGAPSQDAAGNLVALWGALFILELLRLLLDRHEDRSIHGAPRAGLSKYAANFGGNATIYLGIYTAVVRPDYPAYVAAGYLLCIFNLFRVLKYRIYDDLYKRRLDCSGSYRSSDQTATAQAPPNVTLIQGLYNVFLRTYFFVSTTFAFIYLLLVANSERAALLLFKFEKPSGNLFVDFFYYSVFLLGMGGYGDIAPGAVVPKLVSALEMLFGYLFLGSILALILGRSFSGRD